MENLNMGDQMSVCDTCVKENRGMALSESEARIHKDNFPDHNVLKIEDEDIVGEE